MSDELINKKSLSLSKLGCQLDGVSTDILDMVSANGKGELYKKFLERFLTYIPVDYRSKDKIKLFSDFTYEAYDFFMEKPNGVRKIEITQDTYQSNPAITLLISAKNCPFIIDSINSLITKLALQVIFIFHTVISVSRDKNGRLKDINVTSSEDETLVYIKVLGSFSKQDLKKIADQVHQVIDLVDYTYNSWQSLLNKLVTITSDVVRNKKIYDRANLPVEEALDFLNWLQQDNITFLGTADFDTSIKKLLNTQGVEKIWENNLKEISTIIDLSGNKQYESKMVMLGKINKISPVHRNALIDYILIKKLDDQGIYRGGTIIFGLYGTAMYFQSINTIPLLRKRMEYVLNQSGFPINGYNAKKIKNIIESLPRDTLIQSNEDDLYCMSLHMLSSMHSRKLKLFIQNSWSNSFINIIIFLPRENLTPEVYNQISCYLTKKFNSSIVADNITVVAQNFSHLFTTLQVKDVKNLKINHKTIEQDLVKITTNWSDALLCELCNKMGEYEGGIRHQQVVKSFPAEYQYKYDAKSTINDLHYLEEASTKGRIIICLTKGNNDYYYLKFYSSDSALTLSETLPAIENLGFVAINERSFAIQKSNYFKNSWICEFKLSNPIKTIVPFEKIKDNIEEALSKMSVGELITDSLSALIGLLGINWCKVKLLKALTRYLYQTGLPFGKGYVYQTLVKHYKYTETLLDYFAARHDPVNFCQEKSTLLKAKMQKYLDTVSSSTEDRVLKNIQGIVSAILRTNFYQSRNNQLKSYLSFKFDSSKVPDLPLPRPYAEIFVYSNEFEGIHLRGGKIARGGLRWSDRGEDYRTEVLGLMKSQMTKNTVIVPVGSKGCFYINFTQGELPKEEYMKRVVCCYQNFLRGLLDLTDNLIDDKIKQPDDTVIYDDANPYLVVAADKGTATFSDFANDVSNEYNFWLRDAFASGGSVGYDHKKMGITAKGAWISTQLHFLSKGKDIQKEPFTVIGIGDMSGDVFGNGMLLSKYTKLIAAFNHQHIFIDPDPDYLSSYNERLRLFNTPGTRWSDYDKKLFSKGGGVFDRSMKLLSIPPEIQSFLALQEEKITPEELIKALLKLKVDLLWNGGIGTYIKSSSENNLDIGDKANDALRINGNEVAAKVIVEGGNLGLSQLGRIEYALNGGVLNTDFIDNSAGVDCSDHEVNIKIALNSAVASGQITIDERNKLLKQMTQSVEELVLVDNYSQNLALTALELSPTLNVESFSRLIQQLEKEELLDPIVEFLPSKSELLNRSMNNEGMTRPELAVLLSYSKMSLDADLLNVSFIEDEYFKKHLYEYFPLMMRKKFSQEIENHPLRNEIIRTVINNKLINQVGGPIISSIKKETSSTSSNIASAYAVVIELFDLDNVRIQVENLDKSFDINIKVEMLSDLIRVTRRGITWFIRNIQAPINIGDTVEIYSKQISNLTNIMSKLLVGDTKTRFFSRIKYFTSYNVNKQLAKSIATLEVLVSAFDIILLSKQTEIPNEDIARLYFECGEVLNIDWLRQSCEAQINQSLWNRLAVQSLKDDFYDKQKRLIKAILTSNRNNTKALTIKNWLKQNKNDAHVFIYFINEIKLQEDVNLNMMILASKKLELFLRKLEVG